MLAILALTSALIASMEGPGNGAPVCFGAMRSQAALSTSSKTTARGMLEHLGLRCVQARRTAGTTHTKPLAEARVTHVVRALASTQCKHPDGARKCVHMAGQRPRTQGDRSRSQVTSLTSTGLEHHSRRLGEDEASQPIAPPSSGTLLTKTHDMRLSGQAQASRTQHHAYACQSDCLKQALDRTHEYSTQAKC